MSDDEGPNWVDNKRRPRPAPLSGSSVEVSRQSGLAVATGTFGKSSRFATGTKVIGHGASSPTGHLFYSRNQLYKIPLEEEKSCTLGIGERPGPGLQNNPPCVGPGSYEIVHSAKGPKSALDGPEYCSVTIKVKLPSSLTGLPMPSPGPHARYEVRGDLNRGLPTYAKHKPMLGHGGRHETEDKHELGPGSYHVDSYNSVSITASCPNLNNAGERCMEATGGTKRCLKSTFGMASRFSKDKVPNSSPAGDRYYAHSKIWNSEEYLSGARSCSFGASGKTDLSNPLRGPRHNTSPATYYPHNGYSAALATSPLDGMASRCTSPINQFSKNMGSSTKNSTRHKRSPQADRNTTDVLSAGLGGGPPGGVAAGGGDA